MLLQLRAPRDRLSRSADTDPMAMARGLLDISVARGARLFDARPWPSMLPDARSASRWPMGRK